MTSTEREFRGTGRYQIIGRIGSGGTPLTTLKTALFTPMARPKVRMNAAE